jgi:hypothetical protein
MATGLGLSRHLNDLSIAQANRSDKRSPPIFRTLLDATLAALIQARDALGRYGDR